MCSIIVYVPPTRKRTPHSMSDDISIKNSTSANFASVNSIHNQRPRPPLIPSHGTDTSATIHATAPVAFACNAVTGRACRTADQEVVIPQAGQRIPNKYTDVQGGNPNCWCVPDPEGSGCNRDATTSGIRSPNAARHEAMRVPTRMRLSPSAKGDPTSWLSGGDAFESLVIRFNHRLFVCGGLIVFWLEITVSRGEDSRFFTNPQGQSKSNSPR